MAASAGSLPRYLRRLAGGTGADSADDAALLDRFVRGRDEVAFAGLVARHGPLVLGVCRRALRDVQQAEDAFQATFLVLARKAATLRHPDRLPAWLHGTARRLALILCYLEGHTPEEGARMLGCSLGSVRGRVERGRRRLERPFDARGQGGAAAPDRAAMRRPGLAAKDDCAGNDLPGTGRGAWWFPVRFRRATGLRLNG
jgi:DNA-directed RNA polymerase specialized sigma24 family protein